MLDKDHFMKSGQENCAKDSCGRGVCSIVNYTDL